MKLIKTNPRSFLEALNKSKRKPMLSEYTEEQLKDYDLYLVEWIDAGVGMKVNWWEIFNLFNNSWVSGIWREIMLSIEAQYPYLWAIHLDHFEGYLSGFYEGLWYKEYKREAYNPAYDIDGSFKKEFWELDVVYRVKKFYF